MSKKWKGVLKDYLEIVKKTPEVAQIAATRLYNAIIRHGVEKTTHRLSGKKIKLYKYFQQELFGKEEVISEIMDWLHAAARRADIGKRILILVGPTSSGKSTIAALMKKVLEQDPTPIFAIKGCPIHEEPLHALPNGERKEWAKKLGVRIKGKLCPFCQHLVDQKYTDEEGNINWQNIPVEEIKISERKRIGVGTFQPSNPVNQDVSELIGSTNIAMMNQYGEGDPRCYEFNGELEVANRGAMEYIEIIKADIKFHNVLISLAQEGLLKAPRFPLFDLDLVIISHTNETEFEKFKAEKKNEALHSRMFPIYVPHVLEANKEAKIYEKLIERSNFKTVHIAPQTLKIAAIFARATRLYSGDRYDLLRKGKLYDSELTEEEEDLGVDLKEIYEEGRANHEGMYGLDSRFIMNAVNIALGRAEDQGCLFPTDLIKVLKENLLEHDMTVREAEKKQEYVDLLMEDITARYEEIAQKEVNKAFIHAYKDQAQALFDNYIVNIKAFVRKKKMEDPVTGEKREADEKLMCSIEEQISVSENQKREFRKDILAIMGEVLSDGDKFTFETYPRLKEAIENKLFQDLKNVITLTLVSDDVTKSEVREKKVSTLVKNLKDRGYCDKCAKRLLRYVQDLLRK